MTDSISLRGESPVSRYPSGTFKCVDSEDYSSDSQSSDAGENCRREQYKKLRISRTAKLPFHLKEVRVVRRNLCYVVGLAIEMVGDEEKLKDFIYFGKYGKVLNIIVNKNPNFKSPDKKRSCAIYVTFSNGEEAKTAIADIDDKIVGTRRLRASYGTTKYCSNFLKGVKCNNRHCYYLHEKGAENDSFTVDQLNEVKESTRDLTCNALLSKELTVVAQFYRSNFTLFGKSMEDCIHYYLSESTSDDNILASVKEKMHELRNESTLRRTQTYSGYSTDCCTPPTGRTTHIPGNKGNSSKSISTGFLLRSRTLQNDDLYGHKRSHAGLQEGTCILGTPCADKTKTLISIPEPPLVCTEIVHPNLRKDTKKQPFSAPRLESEVRPLIVRGTDVSVFPAPYHEGGVSRLVTNFFLTSADSLATSDTCKYVTKPVDSLIKTPVNAAKKDIPLGFGQFSKSEIRGI